MEESRVSKFPALTGFRALAASMVFFFHYPLGALDPKGFAHAFLSQGYIGVNLFFTLSGFLITYRYLDRAGLGYFRNRFARIYPVYFCLCVLTLALQRRELQSWIVHLLVLTGFARTELVNLHHAWTITAEECFYALAPLGFVLIRRFGRAGIALALAGNLALGWLVARAAPWLAGVLPFIDADKVSLARHPYFAHVLEFFCGVALGHGLLARRAAPASGSARAGELSTWGGLTGIVGVWAYLAWLLWSGTVTEPNSTWHQLLATRALLPLSTAFLIHGLATERSFVSRALGWRPVALLGASSYVFYLIHIGPVGGYLSGRLELGVFSLYFALQALAIAIHKFFEEPVHRFLAGKRRMPRGSPAVAAADVARAA